MRCALAFLTLFAFAPLEAQSIWKKLDGSLKQIDVSPLGSVWGVNKANLIFIRRNNIWEKVGGRLIHVSSGASGVWGVNQGNYISYRNGAKPRDSQGTSWTRVQGTLKQIDSGPSGIVYGVNRYNNIYCRNGVTSSNPTGSGWTRVPGKLKYVSCGLYGCWGVNKHNKIWFRKGVTPTNCKGYRWIHIRGRLKQIEAGPEGRIYGVNSISNLFTRDGITAAQPTGSSWRKIPNVQFVHVSVGTGSQIFALDKVGGIYEKGPKMIEVLQKNNRARNYVFLLTSGFPKGRIGEVKLQLSSSQDKYILSGGQPGLIDIDKNTGKLTLLSNLQNINKGSPVREINYKVQAGKVNAVVSLIILPSFYGDEHARSILKTLDSKVSSNNDIPRRSRPIDPLRLFQILRALPDDDPTKKLSIDELKIEKTLEWTKERIKQNFIQTLGCDTVANAFFHVKQLFSKAVLDDLENLLENHRPANINCDSSSIFRTFNGECNNLNNARLGAADTPFLRILPARYFDTDGLNDPIGFPDQPNAPDVPSPFEISRDFIKVEKVSVQSAVITHAVMQFGQFLDHDIDLTDDIDGGIKWCKGSCNLQAPLTFKAPCYPILPLSNGQPPCTNFVRSAPEFKDFRYPSTRQQANLITAFVDASQIYGSNKKIADLIRDKENDQGLLRESCGNLLPEEELKEGKATECIRGCFQAGDVRSNEQISLNSFHTLFLREHNRIAKMLKVLNNHWDGERVYQATRKIIGAVLQTIVYDDYLPVVIGRGALRPYTGYNNAVDPSISNAFATAAYRFGHSAIRTDFALLNSNFDPIDPALPSIDIRFMFFNNTLTRAKGIEPVLLGLVGNASAIVDRKLASGIINNLFERPNMSGMNLAALNIQRGRDHGLPGYNEFRKLCGLSDAKTFEDTKNEIPDLENRKILSRLYNNDPNLADLWVAGLAESALPGAEVGPTFKCVIAEQFVRTRDGDRFFHERPGIFSGDMFNQIKRTSLSRIYCDNLKGIVSIQENAFKLDPRISCERIPGINLCFWKENFKCGAGQSPRFDIIKNECRCETGPQVYSSCFEALQQTSNAGNGLYNIRDSNNGVTKTYCQMTPLTGCSGGGWTLVMKIDGKQETFKYTSSFWQNKESYNPTGGLSGLDNQETKLPTYWSTSFKQLCVGMKVGRNLKFISIDCQASSLHSLIADGNHRATYLGRQTWKSLISGSSLQTNCNKEGFNVQKYGGQPRPLARVRIGIIGNQENNCRSPDSYLGFGGPPANERNYCETKNVINTCGNSGTCRSDNGSKELKAMGYILVR